MSEKEGGSAFPVVGMQDRNGQGIMSVFQGGMSLRDWFAGQALGDCIGWARDMQIRDGYNTTTEDVANAAYQYADAMLAARNK